MTLRKRNRWSECTGALGVSPVGGGSRRAHWRGRLPVSTGETPRAPARIAPLRACRPIAAEAGDRKQISIVEQSRGEGDEHYLS